MVWGKLIGFVKRTITWGKEVATGNDGMGSASRVVVLMVATAVSSGFIAHIHMNRGLPSADQMYGLSAMLAAGAGAYATNKIRRDAKGGDDPSQPASPPDGGSK